MNTDELGHTYHIICSKHMFVKKSWYGETEDAIAYTSVLDAWASSGRTEKALKTFQEMKQKRFAFA